VKQSKQALVPGEYVREIKHLGLYRQIKLLQSKKEEGQRGPAGGPPGACDQRAEAGRKGHSAAAKAARRDCGGDLSHSPVVTQPLSESEPESIPPEVQPTLLNDLPEPVLCRISQRLEQQLIEKKLEESDHSSLGFSFPGKLTHSCLLGPVDIERLN